MVYAIGGAGNLTTVYAYNVITNTWSTAAPLPSGRDRLGSAILKNSIYCVAGANTPATGSNTLFKYNGHREQIFRLQYTEKKSAGSYEVTWDASNFASGIYFYRLESGNFSNVKKMILIK